MIQDLIHGFRLQSRIKIQLVKGQNLFPIGYIVKNRFDLLDRGILLLFRNCFGSLCFPSFQSLLLFLSFEFLLFPRVFFNDPLALQLISHGRGIFVCLFTQRISGVTELIPIRFLFRPVSSAFEIAILFLLKKL